MPAITRGTVPTAKHLLTLLLLATAPVAARADDGLVDVRNLPRLEGAVEDTARTQSYSLSYGAPSAVAITSEATRKLLSADGWVQYLRPLEEKSSSLTFKKARHGLHVSFSGRADRSVVSYTADRITANVPFPPDATDIMFDERRPYLGCVVPASLETISDFFSKELAAIGWKPLTTADARWPNADLTTTIENGVRAYYTHEDSEGFYRQPPIMLSLQRRADGKTAVEIRVAPFALPQVLEADQDMAGLPRPKRIKSGGTTGDINSPKRKLEVAIIAELPPVLEFYRRELTARGWTEDSSGAVVAADNVALNFKSPEQTATLKLSRKYDLTIANFTTQMTEQALAARARAKKDADDKFMQDAADLAKQVIAADETRRAAQAANLSDAPLRALANSPAPVPLPENAEQVKFDGGDGRLAFESGASVRAIALFYRAALTAQGWKERPSVINKSSMAVLEFSKGGKSLSLTAMQMGPKVNVSANGSGLTVAAAKDAPAAIAGQAAAENKASAENLELDPESALPVPKQRTMRAIGVANLPGNKTPFRRELDASVPADLTAVLAFYRNELGKRGWQEATDRAVVKADQAQLAYTSPEGPVTLQLGRKDGETTVKLVQKNPTAAAQANVMPKPGMGKLVFGNVGNSEVALTINKQTIKIAAGAGGPQSPKGPMLDLPPGKYQYAVKIAGGPSKTSEIEVTGNDTWGLMIAPDGEVLPLQMY